MSFELTWVEIPENFGTQVSYKANGKRVSEGSGGRERENQNFNRWLASNTSSPASDGNFSFNAYTRTLHSIGGKVVDRQTEKNQVRGGGSIRGGGLAVDNSMDKLCKTR